MAMLSSRGAIRRSLWLVMPLSALAIVVVLASMLSRAHALQANQAAAATSVPGSWAEVAQITVAGQPIPLPSDKLLLASLAYYGGSAHIYDPALNTWSSTSGFGSVISNTAATLLPNGTALFTGGIGPCSNSLCAVTDAEIYDPVADTWATTGSLATGRDNHTATLLKSGKVLVAGGQGNTGDPTNGELYDPVAQTWSSAGTMPEPRYNHTALLLADGRVMLVGGMTPPSTGISPRCGMNGCDVADTKIDIYDPATNSWSNPTNLPDARIGYTVTALPNDTVLLAGGEDTTQYPATYPASMIYDPVHNTWTSTPSMITARAYHSAALLPSGQVLVAAGGDAAGFVTACEVYDPRTNSWMSTAALPATDVHENAFVATLTDGRVWLAGGTPVGIGAYPRLSPRGMGPTTQPRSAGPVPYAEIYASMPVRTFRMGQHG
jgi:N-acetylneuraminic acid mutarotase